MPSTTWRSWLIAGVVVTALAVGLGYGLGGGGDDTADATAASAAETAVASSGSGGPRSAFGGGTGGTITAIDGTTLTLDATDPSGAVSPVTIETTDETTVTEAVDGTVDDLAEGDQVLVIGETDDAGDLTAASVVDNGDLVLAVDGLGGTGRPAGGPPEGFEPPDGVEPPSGGGGRDGIRGFPTGGTVTAVDGSTLTVETAAGDAVTVTLTDATTISVTEERSLDDLAEGDTVQVTGQTDGEVVTATAIRLGDLPFLAPMGDGPGGAGEPGGTDG